VLLAGFSSSANLSHHLRAEATSVADGGHGEEG